MRSSAVAQDKGKRGEVIKVMPDEKEVVVQGVNIRKKHQKQVQTQGRTMNPGIIEFEGPIDIWNVMLVCPNVTNLSVWVCNVKMNESSAGL